MNLSVRRDYRRDPVRRLVVMGESNAYGMTASDSANEWVQVVAAGIRRHQDGHLAVHNNSIPANVISPDAPGYEPFRGFYGVSPSAIERFQTDMIDWHPDLSVYAYGLNDSRCGHSTNSFLTAYEKIIRATREALPEALIVLVGPYWNPQYKEALWSDPAFDAHRDFFGVFNRGGDRLVNEYREGIRGLADRHGCLYIDVYPVLEGALWLVHADGCHFTDAGQTVIGSLVFASIAANCSFLSVKSTQTYLNGGFAVRNTGGTNGLAHVVACWGELPPDDPRYVHLKPAWIDGDELTRRARHGKEV
jgi:lysophospholipase L1-like esterase